MKNEHPVAISNLLLIFLCAALASCSIAPAKSNTIKIQRLIFLNHSSKALDKVRIYISKTSEFASCGHILSKSECSTGFPLREYQGNSFDVSWSENGQQKEKNNLRILESVNLIPDRPANAVITFGENGVFSASLLQ